MNCDEAKKIDIVDFLARNGIHSEYSKGINCWYKSPLRNENSPSFKVNTSKNIWYDHGTGQGGDIIRLIKLQYAVSDSEALKILTNGFYSFHQPGLFTEEEKVIISEVKELSSQPLINYILSRKINLEIATRYCKEVHFQLSGRKYYAVGFGNNSNGYELRNKYFKGSSSPKDILLIGNNFENLLVFEGFFDFMSWFTCDLKITGQFDFLILNTLSFLPKAMKTISKYKEVLLFLDNDNAGKKATTEIINNFPFCTDYSVSYKPYKDLNDYLMNDINCSKLN